MSYIAIDLGGTNMRVAVNESSEKKKFRQVKKYPISGSYEKDFDMVMRTISEISDGQVQAIGFGLPGTLNAEKTKLVSATNMPGWVGVDLREKLSDKFYCPVYLENDAVAAALGVAIYDQEVVKELGDSGNFLYLTWGTGIGGALVSCAGGTVEARKVYWERYLQDWEQQCGGKRLEMRFGKSADELDESEWEQVMADCYKHILRISKELEVGSIIMGGGITYKQQERLQALGKQLAGREIDLKISSLGEDIGLLGALSLIHLNAR